MNFTDFKSELKDEFDIPEYKAKEILLFLQRRIREKLTRGIEISLHKIGTFRITVRKPKPYMHLKTGKMKMAKAQFYLIFKASQSMKQALRDKPIYYREESNP